MLICVAIGMGLALADGALTTADVDRDDDRDGDRRRRPRRVGLDHDRQVQQHRRRHVRHDDGARPTVELPGRVVGESTENDITLRLYYDGQAKGVNCVSAVHHGTVTPPGYLRIEIRFADYTGTSWPEYASQDGAPGAAEVTGTYLIATDDRCMSAAATYFASGAGGGSSVSLARVACG